MTSSTAVSHSGSSVGAAAAVPQPELGEVPMPALPGLGHWLASAPALGQHSAEILAELEA